MPKVGLKELTTRFAGEDPQFVAKRLRYASFVSLKHRFLFVETPKAACSTLKWVLADIAGVNIAPRQVGLESNPRMCIHDRTVHPLPSLMDLPANDFHQVLDNPDFTRFCVVRNPYTRLISAWTDKIRQREPGYADMWRQILQHGGVDEPGASPGFGQFANWVVETEDPVRCNDHWRPMTKLLLTEHISYTHIVHTEHIEPEFAVVLESISPALDARTLLARHRTNESLPVHQAVRYDAALAAKVHAYYRNDFDVYGYPQASWQPDRHSPAIQPSAETLALERAAIEAVRARNDVIAELAERNADLKRELASTPRRAVGRLYRSLRERFIVPDVKSTRP